MASGLQSWVEDHSNITMFNFIAYPIFSKTPWYWLQTPPKNYQGQKFSLSFSPSHLKEHNYLSLIQLQQKRKKKDKKSLRNLVVLKWNGGGKLCIPPTTMVWYCNKWKYKKTHHRCCCHQANMSWVLIMHRSEWRLLHDSDLTLNSFLAMFIFLSLLFSLLYFVEQR